MNPFHTLSYVKVLSPVNTLVYGFAMAKQRLTPEAWITAGFRTLTNEGPDRLKAEPLAKSLGTTKGSFYWHFKDVPAFHLAMLDYWEQQAFAGIVDALAEVENPTTRLRMLGQMASSHVEDVGGVPAEPALRAWGRSDSNVSAAIARVDAKREAYLADLLAELDVTNPDYARVLYAALIGLEDLGSRDAKAVAPPFETLIDTILALR